MRLSSNLWRTCLLLMSALAGFANAAQCVDSGIPPRYAPLDAPPITQATRAIGATDAPAGAGCFDPAAHSATLWVTVASLVRAPTDTNRLIARFGAISQLLGVSYWSTTDQKWRPLVLTAHATLAASSSQPRPDYSPAELNTAEDRYYEVTDSRSSQSVTYRLRLRSNGPDTIVVETSNIDPVKRWGITLFGPDGLHTLYFLNQRTPGVWSYYSVSRILPQSFLAAGHEKSYINRAVALYRYFTQRPTNAEPPAAR